MGSPESDKSRLFRHLVAYRHLLRRPPASGRFLVLSQSRCGTTLFTQLLNSHPEIACERELLANWVPWPEQYIESHRRRHPSKVFGCKVFIHHLIDDQRVDPAEFLDHLQARGYQFLYLKRENLLRHGLSQLLRKATGVTHTTEGNVARSKYRIDVDKLIRHMEVRERFWDEAEKALSGRPHYQVSYERDLQDGQRHQPTMDEVFPYLGLEPAPVQAVLKRINDKSLPELIENYDELERALRHTPYESWLEQSPPLAHER